MSVYSLPVIDVQRLLRRPINPNLGLVRGMPYVLGIGRLVWVGSELSGRTYTISEGVLSGESQHYRRRILPSLRN